jgi:hypothetical protein
MSAASISEFERLKPHKTYKMIEDKIRKYEKISEVNPQMDDIDCAIQRTATMVVEDLREIFTVFQSGE